MIKRFTLPCRGVAIKRIRPDNRIKIPPSEDPGGHTPPPAEEQGRIHEFRRRHHGHERASASAPDISDAFVSAGSRDPFAEWFSALEARHLTSLSFQEIRRGLQALSSLYVERRRRLPSGAALEGAGKRAAFALFYGPLHFLITREVVRALGAHQRSPSSILDLGCGTGAAAAAWAIECCSRPRIAGVDRSAWAIEEARWTYRVLGVRGGARRGELSVSPLPGAGGSVVAAYTVNEIDPEARARLLEAMIGAAHRGGSILVIEPISGRASPWWSAWSAVFAENGGRDDEWRFPMSLPEKLRLLDRAAGLDHRELTARSLWLPGGRAG